MIFGDFYFDLLVSREIFLSFRPHPPEQWYMAAQAIPGDQEGFYASCAADAAFEDNEIRRRGWNIGRGAAEAGTGRTRAEARSVVAAHARSSNSKRRKPSKSKKSPRTRTDNPGRAWTVDNNRLMSVCKKTKSARKKKTIICLSSLSRVRRLWSHTRVRLELLYAVLLEKPPRSVISLLVIARARLYFLLSIARVTASWVWD